MQLSCQANKRLSGRKLVKQAAGSQLGDHILKRGLLSFRERQLGGDLGHVCLHQVGLRAVSCVCSLLTELEAALIWVIELSIVTRCWDTN